MRRRCRGTRSPQSHLRAPRGFIGQLFNYAYLDGAAWIAIGLLLMSAAGILAPRTRGLLPGEGVNPHGLADLRRHVESDPSIERAVDIPAMYLGPHDLLVNRRGLFTAGTPAERMRGAIRRIGAYLGIAYPETSRVHDEAEEPLTVKRSGIGTAL